MPARRRKQPRTVVYRPTMPVELQESPRPDVAEPGPAASVSEWARWEQSVAGAYRAQEQARATWAEEHAHLPYDPARLLAAVATPDEVFCGFVADHVCGGAECPQRPARGVVEEDG